MESCKLVRLFTYDSWYNILKVVKGGGDLEEGEVPEHYFILFFAIFRNILVTSKNI